MRLMTYLRSTVLERLSLRQDGDVQLADGYQYSYNKIT